MSIQSLIKERLILGSFIGNNVITVGDGGRFPTIDAALSFIEAQTGATQVSGTTGTVAATQNSDVVTGTGTNFRSLSRPGDMIRIEGDGIGLVTGNIKFPIFGNVTTETSLVMGCGFAGTTGTGLAWELWRPERYVLFLLPGTHTISSTHTIPDGMFLSIVGAGKMVTSLETSVVSPAIAIYHQRSGGLEITGLTLARTRAGASSIIDTALDGSVINDGFIVSALHDVHILDTSNGAGNMVVIKSADNILSNITGQVYAGLGNFSSDRHIVNNLQFKAYAGGADVAVFTNASFGDYKGTKQMTFNAINIHRPLALVTGAGALLEIQDLDQNREVFMNNLVIIDEDQQASSNPHCMALNGGGTGTFYVQNSLIDAGNTAGAGQGGINAANAGDNVYLMGTYGRAGSAVRTEGSATFTTVY